MMFLCVLFVPPVYFMARSEWGTFVLNAILYGIARLCMLSIVGITVASLFWLLAMLAGICATKRWCNMPNCSSPRGLRR